MVEDNDQICTVVYNGRAGVQNSTGKIGKRSRQRQQRNVNGNNNDNSKAGRRKRYIKEYSKR